MNATVDNEISLVPVFELLEYLGVSGLVFLMLWSLYCVLLCLLVIVLYLFSWAYDESCFLCR